MTTLKLIELTCPVCKARFSTHGVAEWFELA